MQLTLTTAGLAALVNAQNTGTDPVLLEEIGLTSTNFTPNAGMTALPGEFKRVTTIGGDVVDEQVMHVLLRDESADVYTLRGFALYLEDGTLFGLYGQAAAVVEKAAAAVLLLALDVRFSDIAAALIEFGDTTFIDPPATTTRAGVVELATNAEALAGTDTQRGITPANLKHVLDNSTLPDASTTVKGKVELATSAETTTGTDSERAITPAGLSSRTATTTRTGLVELATNTEAIAGTDTDRAVTPAGVAAAISSSATPDASTTVKGRVELATSAETTTGTDSERAITPAGLSSRTATTTRTGLVELATDAETVAGLDTDRATTPAGVAAAIASGWDSGPDWERRPSGVIEQWGTATVSWTTSGVAGEAAVVFPIPFPNACHGVIPTPIQPTGALGGNATPYYRAATTHGVQIGLDCTGGGETLTVSWRAWGH